MYVECRRYSCGAILRINCTALYLRELKNDRIATGFDRLAPVYQCLSEIVFGKSLAQAQQHNLNFIKSGDRVLILGGGSGVFLKSLLDQPAQITVDYIDLSGRMIQMACDKTKNPKNVNFIIGTEHNIPQQSYTIVITHFYLDLFSNNTLPDVIREIKTHITQETQWLVTDFVSEKWWHKIMIWIMYRFFRILTGIEARTLPHWEYSLAHANLLPDKSKKFFGGFIKSVRWIPKA